jgi:hypothetical protein
MLWKKGKADVFPFFIWRNEIRGNAASCQRLNAREYKLNIVPKNAIVAGHPEKTL